MSRELIGMERRWLAPQKSLSGVPQRQKVPARWNLSALQWFSIFFLLGVELRRLLELGGLCRLGLSACAWLAAGDRPCELPLLSESCFDFYACFSFEERSSGLARNAADNCHCALFESLRPLRAAKTGLAGCRAISERLTESVEQHRTLEIGAITES